MKKIVAIVLALVLLAAIGATAYATQPIPVPDSGSESGSNEGVIIYKPNFAILTGEQEYESDDFAVGSKVVEDGVNPDTGLHFGF